MKEASRVTLASSDFYIFPTAEGIVKPKYYSTTQLIRKVWPFFRVFLAKYSFAIVLLVITGLLSLAPPYLVKVLIDSGVRTGKFGIVSLISALLLLCTIVAGLARGVMDYIHEWVSANFITALRAELFLKVLKQPVSFFSSVKTGDILSRLRSDTTAVYSVLVNTLIGALGELIQILGTVGFLLYLNWRLALVALSFIPLLHLTFIRYGRPLRRMALAIRDKDVSLLDFLQERINNVQLVKLYHGEQCELNRHAKLSAELISIILASVKARFVSIFLIGFLTSAAGILVLWYGGYTVLHGGLSVGALFAFYLYTAKLYGPLQSLTNRTVEIYSSLASVQRIAEFLDLRPSIIEVAQPKALQGPVIGHLTFRNVAFRYGPSSNPVLSKLNMTIYPGQKLALVGASGAGKTTLINLVARLYDVEDGSIELDGIDIRDLKFQELYNSIAVVPQETFLFDATIEENIRYGKEGATLDEIMEAARMVQLHDFITALPDGYDTVIGPRGSLLSGGQRQRLALARVVLKNAPIWLLDEFTTALDSHSELAVQESLHPLLSQKTSIIIAHRHSTIKVADVVAVLDDGVIKEMGSHQELYGRQGQYRKLFDTQLIADGVYYG